MNFSSQHIVHLLQTASLPQNLLLTALSAIRAGDLQGMADACVAMKDVEQGKVMLEFGKWILENAGFDSRLSEILGDTAAARGDSDQAYFYLFNAFRDLRELRLAEKLLRLFRDSRRLDEGLTFLKSLEDEVPNEWLEQQRASFQEQLGLNPKKRNASYHHRHFVVSSLSEFLPSPGSDVYIAEPFLEYLLKKHDLLSQFASVEVAPYVRQSPSDLEEVVAVAREKQDKYIRIFSKRLNEIHGLSLSHEFWKRSFSFSFERNVTGLYEMFLTFERYFTAGNFQCNVLSEDSYYIPLDFDEQRYFIEHWQFGREQGFSCFIKEFHTEEVPQISKHFVSPYKVREGRMPTEHKPVVGIMGSWFAPAFMSELVNRSEGAVQHIGFKRHIDVDHSKVDKGLREKLLEPEATFDRFDRFFFRCMKHLFPKVYLEYFPDLLESIASQFADQEQLKYIVSELWIGESYEPLAIALLKETRGVQCIYHEHNCNHQQYRASLVPRIAERCDVYAAHGNYRNMPSNALPLGSLFDFGNDLRGARKDFEITYVSGVCFARDSDSSCSGSSLGFYDEAPRKLAWKKKFFESLSSDVRENVNYRGYPFDDFLQHWESKYDERTVMGDALNGIRYDDLTRSGKEVMAASRLVVIDYLMTTFLESLNMNVPTILLFAHSSELFSETYRDYLVPLQRVGMCQTDPVEAAAFIQQVYREPESWWLSEEVQAVRSQFLEENLGEPQKMIEYLLNLAKS